MTYLTAWTLVKSQQNAEFRQLLASLDVCYADGMGVVLALLFTKFRRIRKVTANSFYPSLFEEISHRGLKVALVGGQKGVSQTVASRIEALAPSIDICLCRTGYLSDDEEQHLVDELTQANPHIVFLSMGQPLQEQCAHRWRQALPHTVFYCVGGLFDLIAGRATFAPAWIRQIGLEWLWRLVHSPKQLWRRYLTGLPLLAIYILHNLAPTQA